MRCATALTGWPANSGVSASPCRASVRPLAAPGNRLAMPTGVTVGSWAQAACRLTGPSSASMRSSVTPSSYRSASTIT